MRGKMRKWIQGAAAAGAALVFSAGAAAAQAIGQSAPGQLDLQAPATPVAQQILDLHHLMLIIITGICVFVLALLGIVIVRFRQAANPTPAKWTHNSLVEVIWTVVPVIILFVIALPSVKLLVLQEDFSNVDPDVRIKAIGNKWYWEYQYMDEDFGSYVSNMIGSDEATLSEGVSEALAQRGYPDTAWKLAVDSPVVVPVNKTVLVEVTASDVIHAWAVPAFGVKADGVPGRINRTWFKAEKEGIFFGQCSELCGEKHSFMPITVKVVSQDVYDTFISCMKEEEDAEICGASPTMLEIMEQQQRVAEGAGEGAGRQVAAADLR